MTLELTPAQEQPPHVPAELAYEFDAYLLPDTFSDAPHAYWKAVQDSYPSIFWTPHHGGHWVVTRGEDIKHIQADHEQFSNNKPFIPMGSSPWMIPEMLDPPEHASYRRILAPAFLPRALVEIEKMARQVAIEIIEELRPRGECEFVTDFSGVMPITAFLTICGLPISDGPMLREWTKLMSPQTNPRQAEGWANITRYVQEWIARFKAEPGEGLISHIVHAEVDGRPVTDDEVLSMCLLVVSGGLDTVVLMTSFTAHHLARHPQDRQYLREHPEKIAHAVEEFARRFGTSNLAREIRMDLDYKNITMRKGEQVLLPFPLYGLDDRIHDDPLKVDFDRRQSQHTAFGSGVHTCIGAALARREIKIFLEEWLTRIPDFQIKAGTRPDCGTGLINTISNLQLEWQPS